MICNVTNETALLATYERVIEQGLQSFDDTLEVGRALAQIRDGKLYKQSHKTFESYCVSRWSISRPRAYQLIDAAALAEDLSTVVDKMPTAEWQVRPLARLPADERAEAWREAVETAGEKPVTAKLVSQVVNRRILHSRDEPQPKDEEMSGPTTGDLSSLLGQKFTTIYADPPWRYGNQGTRAATDNHYSTMTVEQICNEPVSQLCTDDARLFLWTTTGLLRESFSVIDAWGFVYKSQVIWCKPQMGIGNYVRVSHEILMIAVRPESKPWADRNRSVKSWQVADRTKHSEKPDDFRKMVESLSPGPYLELYGRKQVSGWTVYGNQIHPRLF